MQNNKKHMGRTLSLIFLAFFILLPTTLWKRESGVVRAQSSSVFTVGAYFDTSIINWCTNEDIGYRKWELLGTYDPGTGVLSGIIKFTRIGTNANGALKRFFLAENFHVYDESGNLLATIPAAYVNQASGDYPIAPVTLARDPYVVRVSGTQFKTFGQCPPGPNEDDYTFPFENLASNPYFNIPCPIINSFTVAPNPAAPSANVTLAWNISNLYVGRRFILTGPGAPTAVQTAPIGSETFPAPSTPGPYTYRLTIYEADGSTPVTCVSPATAELTVTSTSYFWLVKRIAKPGVTYPPGAPPFYVEPDIGTPGPGTNNPASYVRVPDTGSFTASSDTDAWTREPFLTMRLEKEQLMQSNDRQLPGGLASDDYVLAFGDYRNALNNLYPKALANFNRQTPGYSGPRQGPGIPENDRAPKRNERVDPFEN